MAALFPPKQCSMAKHETLPVQNAPIAVHTECRHQSSIFAAKDHSHGSLHGTSCMPVYGIQCKTTAGCFFSSKVTTWQSSRCCCLTETAEHMGEKEGLQNHNSASTAISKGTQAVHVYSKPRIVAMDHSVRQWLCKSSTDPAARLKVTNSEIEVLRSSGVKTASRLATWQHSSCPSSAVEWKPIGSPFAPEGCQTVAIDRNN